MDEGGIYVAVSAFLRRNGWQILGGQPPSGTDHVPVLEVKDPNNRSKGSKGAFKPDLVAWDGSVLLLTELKPRFSESDRDKLVGILGDSSRIAALWDEIRIRHICDSRGTPIFVSRGTSKTWGALGFSGSSGPLNGLWALRVERDGRVTLTC